MGGPISNPVQKRRGTDLGVDVALGLVSGVGDEDKFGRNTDLGDADTIGDVWDELGIYEFITELTGGSQASGVQLTVSSTSAEDELGETGATEVTIFGLDANYDSQSEVVVLEGQGAVTTSGTYTRIHRMVNTSTLAVVGIIRAGSGDVVDGVPANVYCRISVGEDQSQMAIWTVANGCKFIHTSTSASLLQATGATVRANMRLRVRPTGEVFQTKDNVGLSTTGTSSLHTEHQQKNVYAAKTDIKIDAVASANNADVSASFGGFEVAI